jgi:hypothetical protein
LMDNIVIVFIEDIEDIEDIEERFMMKYCY